MLAIYDGNGTLQCRYVYDAWGNHKVLNADGTENAATEFIGNKNPFRYRSYYWDSDFALYYLKSRYYDPELGRFISADGVSYLNPESVAGLNLYAYCENNPVMGYDSEGTWDSNKFWGWLVNAAIAVAAVAAIAVVAAGVVASGGLLGAALVGAGVGALTAMSGNIIAQGGFKNADPWQIAKAGGIGGAIGAISGVFSYGVGAIGEFYSQQFGVALSNTTHISSGIKFGKIFSTEFLAGAGKVIGGTIGGIIGGTGMNYLANELFGNHLNSDDALEQGIKGEVPMWFIKAM